MKSGYNDYQYSSEQYKLQYNRQYSDGDFEVVKLKVILRSHYV